MAVQYCPAHPQGVRQRRDRRAHPRNSPSPSESLDTVSRPNSRPSTSSAQAVCEPGWGSTPIVTPLPILVMASPPVVPGVAGARPKALGHGYIGSRHCRTAWYPATPLPRTFSGRGRALHRQATLFRRQHVGHSPPTHKDTDSTRGVRAPHFCDRWHSRRDGILRPPAAGSG
jgi:hypothetical protein